MVVVIYIGQGVAPVVSWRNFAQQDVKVVDVLIRWNAPQMFSLFSLCVAFVGC